MLPTVYIKQIETFVPTDSSFSYCHSQSTRFHSVEAEIPLVNNTSWSADGIVISIHITLAVLPTCMYGCMVVHMADVYENGRMKSGHKSHPIMINSFIYMQILQTEEINVKTKNVGSPQAPFLMCTLEIPQKLQHKFFALNFCYLYF